VARRLRGPSVGVEPNGAPRSGSTWKNGVDPVLALARVPRELAGGKRPVASCEHLSATPAWTVVSPRERELLTGMGNCYEACHEDFAGTIGMVAGARNLDRETVLATLESMRARFSNDEEYRTLRRRLPPEFPL
jgi:hypothetical protein